MALEASYSSNRQAKAFGALEDISIFCDESCHLENDNQPLMALGAILCPGVAVGEISRNLRGLKREHGLKPADATSHGFEAKWSKVSPAKLAFYESLVRLFVEDDRLSFRCLIVADKSKLNHKDFDQTHDDFYYKMYYNLLIQPLSGNAHRHSVYLDIKDTKGGQKTKKLHDYLCSKLKDDASERLAKVQQMRSHESELMQLCDVLLGAISYYNRGEATSSAKMHLIDVFANFGRQFPRDLGRTSFLSEKKVNLFYWKPAGL